MPLTVFDNAYFLAALGWAVGNSLWQAGILWMLYKLITLNKKQSSLFCYNLSILFLFLSFGWFAATVIQNYFLLKDTSFAAISIFGAGKLFLVQKINAVLPYMSLLYLALLCFYVARFIKQYRAINIIKSTGLHKASVDIRLFITNTAAHLGIKKKVAVWISDNVDVPSVIGFLKPIVLLPAAALNNLTSSQVETILLHELAHIKRNDFLINLFQSVIEVLLFFNPFVMLLSKAAKKEREHCCDDWVINYQYSMHDYAGALLVIEKQRQQQLAFALAATNGKKDLLNRIKRLFSTTPQTDFRFTQKLKLTGLGATVVTLILTALPLLNTKDNTTTVVDEKPAAAIFASLKDNVQGKTIINEEPAVVKNESAISKPIVKTRKPVKVKISEPEEYSLALINEELLKRDQELQAVAVQAAEKAAEAEKLFVKIEEEQSGKKQKNTYYFEVNNENGVPQVKPLVILNKFNKAEPNKKTQKSKDKKQKQQHKKIAV